MSHRDDPSGRLATLQAERATHRRQMWDEFIACHEYIAREHGREVDRLTFEISVIEHATEELHPT